MLYSIDNVIISMFINLAVHLKSKGWNIFWHASGETEAFTTGPELGTITLIQHIPANPTFISTPASGNYTDQDTIVVPAFAMVAQPPVRLDRLGLGDTRYERELDLRISGIVVDSRQQSLLASTVYEWLQIEDVNYYMPISDYTIPAAPVALDPAEVWAADVKIAEIATEVDSTRYQIHVEILLRFVE